jgi:uncharacterized protein (DUF58 family)
MADTPPLDDPTALARYGRLEVVARLIIEGYLLGRHRSPFRGSTAEFVEHREYAPGDEVRRLDWRAYAKTGQYYIKLFAEETNLRAYLLVDASGSMSYAGQTLSKFDYARTLAAALAYLLISQRDSCGLVTFADAVLDRIEPATSTTHFQRLVDQLESRRPSRETRLAPTLETILPLLQRRSLVFLLSDGFDEVSDLSRALRLYRAARHELVFLHVVAPEEETFPFTRPTQFRSLETAHRERVDPLQLRTSYLEQYRSFCQGLRDSCAEAGFDYLKLTTDQSYVTALGAYLTQRAR